MLASLHNPELPDSVQQVVKLALEEVISLGLTSCEPEHLLLGVLREAGKWVHCTAAYLRGADFLPAHTNGHSTAAHTLFS